jgi:hypothetical protein
MPAVVQFFDGQMDHVMNRLSPWWLLLLFVGPLPLGGCLSRSRAVPVRMSTAPLQTATCAELIERISSQASEIRTLETTVGIAALVGGSKWANITEYQEIRGYILAREPSSLWMSGLFPIFQNQVFDMVSNRQEFRLWIPTKNQFIVGNNQMMTLSDATAFLDEPKQQGRQVLLSSV